ncbi:MAG: bifunctional 4-hydroxy-3-methylbut-2-enyl diphosphate reductase/30S ribosomal protein S1 [Defluviitaleaceae bacterium]|nr:bifunctional 4-hydroxy-3-methylbut-2-enyl diphosphate reductase/30S ribosomal protein S1 [Defluviitaleaceae bacterium]
MEIILADVYGFCFGVQRAVDGVYKAAAGGKVVTLGPVTHNKRVLLQMADAGIDAVDCIDDVAGDATVVIRAHGVPPAVYRKLDDKGLNYVDLTCPSVTANQKLAKKMYDDGCVVILTGDANHPEIIGINGWADDSAIVVSSVDDVAGYKWDNRRKYFLMSQTTFSLPIFAEIKAELEKAVKKLEIADTICKATRDRQEACANLAKKATKMVVLGDATSSNSKKLYEISKALQKNTYFIEKNEDLGLINFSVCDTIGITAGASTPPDAIKEAIKRMKEIEKNLVNAEVTGQESNEVTENFEDMLKESVTSLRTGQVVTGEVISVVHGEVMVDLKYKSDGIIQRGQFSENPNVDPADEVKPGDSITVFVLRVNDGEGHVLLSKRRVDANKGLKIVEDAFASGEPVLGKVTEAVKGGIIVMASGIRVFVPSSQVSARFAHNMEEFVGRELEINIIELNKSKRPWRIIGGRKELVARQEKEAREKALAGIEEGSKVNGTVSSVARFGAFVDIGGIDGLLHITELGWGRVKNVSDMLKIGDKVEAYVIKVNRETGKISLTLKSAESDPWYNLLERFPIGSVVVGKVVRMMPFGAFVQIADGVDGLVHISQISHKHIKSPEDVLTIGQEVEVRISEIVLDKRRISLSIKQAADMDYDDDDYDDYDDDDYDDYDDYDDDEIAEEVVAENTEE